MEQAKKRKMNPILAWLLVSFKFMWFAIRYGSSKSALLDYSTGEVTAVDR